MCKYLFEDFDNSKEKFEEGRGGDRELLFTCFVLLSSLHLLSHPPNWCDVGYPGYLR